MNALLLLSDIDAFSVCLQFAILENALGQRINANTKGLQISKNGKRIVK